MSDVSALNPQAIARALSGLQSQDDVEAVSRVAMRYVADPAFRERVRLQVLAIRQARIEVARRESSTFCEYVIRNEKNGAPIRQADFHEQMHRIMRVHRRVIMWGSPNTGKSLQMAVGWPLWLLGRNPELHIAIVQATDERAKKTVSALASYISVPSTPGYAELHEVFPDLQQGDGIWNKSALTVKRKTNARDPSVAAYSTGSTGILGARIDVLILDDVLTFENTRTPEQRLKVLEWIKSTLVGRVDPEHGIILFMGNAWHPEDAMHVLSRNDDGEDAMLEDDDLGESAAKALESLKALGADDADEGKWVSARFPLRDEYGQTTWAEVWPQHALNKRARELGDAEAARQLDCTPTSDATSRFKREWFARCMAKGLYGTRDGRPVLARYARPMVDVNGVLEPADGRAIYVGVDIGLEDDGDLSAISALAVDHRGDVELMGIRSGHWKIDDFVSLIFRVYDDLKPRAIFIESNGAQRILARIVKGDLSGLGLQAPRGIRSAIRNFETGVIKHHPKWGVEGIGIELAAGRWKIPCGPAGELHPEIEAWIQDCMHYSPSPKVHTGDRLMAVYIAWDGFRRRLTRMAPAEAPKGLVATSAPRTAVVERAPLPGRAVEPKPSPVTGSSLEDRLREAQERDVFGDLSSLLAGL